MPELPDVIVYVEALDAIVKGHRLNHLQLVSPFVLRSVDPPIDRANGQIVRDVRRIGKRIVLALDAPPPEGEAVRGNIPREPGAAGDQASLLFLVVHLMIAGRLRWREPTDKVGLNPKLLLAVFEFDHGRLLFTEAGSKKRASLQLVRGRQALDALDPGGVEPLDATLAEFRAALTRESHTLKRALTDPHLLSGIGNAYSDEILHAARLSPLKLTRALSDQEVLRLYDATRATLTTWVDRLRRQAGGRFPDKVTAFREEMAVHGRFRQPCPVCGSPVQRIVYAENECNYCATCQTGGRLLADRSLSRLLRDDWPKRLE
jgi:formamidopyrimidine-DNA glycosylase